MALDLTHQCDATASGTETAYFTWILQDGGDMLPAELRFCAHHNGEHFAALKLAGWSPAPTEPVIPFTETANV